MDSITQDVYCKRKVQKLYDFTLSSRVWSDGGFVAFRAVCWGNCSRMLWIELAVCYFRIAPVCIATDRENKSTIRMSAKIDYQLRQVCLSVFLPAWKYWAKTRRIFMKCNTHTHTHTHTYIYIYIYVYMKTFRKCVENSSLIELWEESKQCTWQCTVGAIMVISELLSE